MSELWADQNNRAPVHKFSWWSAGAAAFSFGGNVSKSLSNLNDQLMMLCIGHANWEVRSQEFQSEAAREIEKLSSGDYWVVSETLEDAKSSDEDMALEFDEEEGDE
jgi:hypothetical protein